MHDQHQRTRRERCLGRAALAVFITAVQAATLVGQTPVRDPRDTTHAQTQAPFFVQKDALLAVGFVAATAIMIPLDRHIAEKLRDSSTQANHFFKRASTGVEVIASPGAYIIGGTLYAVGRIGKFDRVADLGWHGTEAVLFAQGVTYVLKGFVGRARPFLSDGRDPDDFNFGKGFRSGDWTSFPSGHASTAFAAAAAVTNETSRWWPRSVWVVGPLMYAGATAVGASRMYHSRHWGSDVVIGAAIGTFSGRKVVQYAHGHPGNRIDRILLHTTVAPDGHGGGALGFSFQP